MTMQRRRATPIFPAIALIAFLLLCAITLSGLPSNVSGMNLDISGRPIKTADRTLVQQDYMLSATTLQWSPDGRYIAFGSNHGGDQDIYLIDVMAYMQNESRDKQAVLVDLTNSEREEGSFNWSPDSQYIAMSAYENGNEDIFVINIDSRETTRFTVDEAIENGPAWSPDGRYIAYDSQQSGVRRILRKDLSDESVVVLASGAFPQWSADGSHLAFLAVVETEEGVGNSLTVVDRDGGNAKSLLPGASYMSIDWSPNDSSLAFTGYFDEQFQSGIVDSRTGETELLMPGREPAFVMGWSHDGQKLSIVSGASGNQDVYVFSLSDNTLIQATHTELNEHNPAWSPTENRLAYWLVDPIKGEQNLIVQDLDSNEKYVLSSIPLYYTLNSLYEHLSEARTDPIRGAKQPKDTSRGQADRK